MKNTVFKFTFFLLLVAFLATAQAGEVMIYTGNVNWITKEAADAQAQICFNRLEGAGITTQWLSDPADSTTLADWMDLSTDNGELDVLILYGYVPDTIYAAGNGQPDGSIAELFIESEDGDTIIYHADWMFYVSSTNNATGGLQNMMDIPNIVMGVDNTPMYLTDEGRTIAPNLTDFVSDRPFAVDQLAGDWFVEAALAQDVTGTRVDPCIVRDGNRGRLVSLYQTNTQDDPKGAVAAEVIAWLMDIDLVPTQLGLSGSATTVAGTPAKLTLSLQDEGGVATKSGSAVTVTLASDSATGAFDTEWAGNYDGTLTSVTIPAGETSTTIYYKDSSAKLVTLSATTPDLTDADMELNVLEDLTGTQGEVAIYTGLTWWITKEAADEQAQICIDKLDILGITNTLFESETDVDALADWMIGATDNGEVDVLILYGEFPDSIYPSGNTQPDGSIAELFLESTDGDVIINHADWMFYGQARNAAGGLQNMMDIPTIDLGGNDNTPMVVTDEGGKVAPSLSNFLTDRPIPVGELINDWFVEVALAENGSGSLMDPCIIRDGNRGRLIPVFQTENQDDPKGAVAAEIITWLFGIDVGGPTQIGFLGKTKTYEGEEIKLSVQAQDKTGSPSHVAADKTVTLQTNSPTGAFDITPDGAFDGSITSVTIVQGQSTAEFYYKDMTVGTPTLTGSVAGLTTGTHEMTIFQRFAEPGEVAIYTGNVNWINKGLADAQAQICSNRLNGAGVSNQWYSDPADVDSLSQWMLDVTDNGKLDVLVLYGYFPTELYPAGNMMPDGSIAELFIESTDGDTIINHADWMFYVSSTNNGGAGLQNMMDIPNISMAGNDNTPMVVTAEGAAIAPSLTDFMSDRPFRVNDITGDWFVEMALAQDATGTLLDPCIVRDGDRGRLIPMFQAANQDDPKGAVAAEVIAWLMGATLPSVSQVGIDGSSSIVVGIPVKLTISLQDEAGVPIAPTAAVTVNLASDSATGAFDTVHNGSYDGTVTSVTIPANEPLVTVYYKDTSPKNVSLTATAPGQGLTEGEHQVNFLEDFTGSVGEVMIYDGNTSWITKDLADEQAQICVDALNDLNINNTWLQSPADETQLADWMTDATDNGKLDILVLYGWFPTTIYPAGNTMPDDSLAELFIESTDGDVIMNHADYMFYVSTTNNDVTGLQNMMDIPGITMWDDNTPMVVTEEGATIAPSLADFLSDRPFHTDELAGDWFVEAALAENSAGTRADPCIVRDGNRGRLVNVYQTASQNDPKGAVAAEIIDWIMGKASGSTEPLFKRGDVNADNSINLADAIFVLAYLFAGGDDPTCMDTADANDDGSINLADAISILSYLFSGGSNLPDPFSNCGVDPTGDSLSCDSFTPCGK